MPDDRRDEPHLSGDELQTLALIEGWLALDDPALDHRLRTGRRMPRRVDPVHAGIGAAVITLLVPLILIVIGPPAGAAAAVIGTTALPVWLLLCAGFGSSR